MGFSEENSCCDEAPEPTSLPYSLFVRGFPAFFRDYRDSGVTTNHSGDNRMIGAHFQPHGGIFEAAVC
jgi:hypothetical protein